MHAAVPDGGAQTPQELAALARPDFEVLLVHPQAALYEARYRAALQALQGPQERWRYELVVVDSAQAALCAALERPRLQVAVLLPATAPADAATQLRFARCALPWLDAAQWQDAGSVQAAPLAWALRHLRPHLDLLWLDPTGAAACAQTLAAPFAGFLGEPDPFAALHAHIVHRVQARFQAPYFEALRAYARREVVAFHALPLSRGASLQDSTWMGDVQALYPRQQLALETSSTQGGLDSLLAPTGVLQQAQALAARDFGAQRSFFVTNGTSAANKIVLQSLLHPGDIALIGADCHKSVAQAVTLAGAQAVLIEPYTLPAHGMVGAVTLAQLKGALLRLRSQGLLERVRTVTLTHSSFDGIVYHAQQYMLELLAIKADLVFHWDEAWFAFAAFHPLYRGRSAMGAASALAQRLSDPAYHAFYARWRAAFDADTRPDKWLQPLYPDPRTVQMRVYATQSTHKTLSAMRQGSMVHVADGAWDEARFVEVYRTHTSTSPNTQILASLDTARRQAALEGYAGVRRTLALALQLRQRIAQCPLLRCCMRVLDAADLVPGALAGSPAPDGREAVAALHQAWAQAPLALDPTRITLDIARTGMDGPAFRALLMQRYGVQVNKTTPHTVLLVLSMGSSADAVDYLVGVLQDIATHCPSVAEGGTGMPAARALQPGPRHWLQRFCPQGEGVVDLRAASEAARGDQVQHLVLDAALLQAVARGRVWVAARAVTPYPPGYPVLLPGQVLSVPVLQLLLQAQRAEVHGWDPQQGLCVFTDAFVQAEKPPRLHATAVLPQPAF
ncbi:MAG: aminotransferase class I/II-fold pyridoxal phosphate-dependent enzyme [Rhodoferax sp.]